MSTSKIILKYLGKFGKLTLKGAIVGGGFSGAQYAIEEIIASTRNTVDGTAHEKAPLTDEQLADVVTSPHLRKLAKEDNEKQEKEDAEKLSRLKDILEEQDEMERKTEAAKRTIKETMMKIQIKKDTAEKQKNEGNLKEKAEYLEKKLKECEEEKRQRVFFVVSAPRNDEILCDGHGLQTVECCDIYQARTEINQLHLKDEPNILKKKSATSIATR